MIDNTLQGYWFKHVFIPLAKPSKADLLDINAEINEKYISAIKDNNIGEIDGLKEGVEAAKSLLDIIENQRFDVDNSQLETYCDALAGYYEKAGDGSGYLVTASDVLKILANILSSIMKSKVGAEIIWDTSKVDLDEVNAFKTTILGKALDEAGLIRDTSGEMYKGVTPQPQSRVGGRSATGTAKRSELGPMGKNLRGIENSFDATTGKADKIYFSSPYAFKIVDPTKVQASNKSKKASAVVKPQLKDRSGEGRAYDSNCVNMIIPNNYDQAICFFETESDAREFVRRIVEELRYVGTLEIEKTKAESNGYLRVKTDLGSVYIAAKAFNEELEEDFDEENNFDDIFDRYLESANSSLDALNRFNLLLD